MRRSTRLSVKRTNFTPESSDDDEPKKLKPEPKINHKTKLSQKKQNKQNYYTDVSTEIRSQPKANNYGKTLNNKKSKKDEDSDGSSSESDIENYLQPADQIDLNSTYFQITKPEEKKSFEAIESNIFAGINRLSDSESESEFEEQENEASPVKKAKSKKTKVIDQEPTPIINFQHVQDYNKKLEEAKKLVEKYEANKKKLQKKQGISTDKKSEIENQDISNLLAVGEAKLDSSTEPQTSMRSSDFESFSESEKEDWEEVEEGDIKETQESVGMPKDDLQITVELPTVMRKKKGRDLVASMKRRLNRIRKEHQVLVHKVHVLCWVGHGNYINATLNDEVVLALILSLIPAQYCYKSGLQNMNHLEEILEWYKSTVPNIEKRQSKDMALDKLLKLQIIRKEAFNKKMLVYMFVCLLRSLGIQCRLVISFQVTPLRPPASELHSLSTKSSNKKDVKVKNQEANNSKEMSKESNDSEINNDDESKMKQDGVEENGQKPKKELKKLVVGGKKESKRNKNKSETVKETTRTRNATKNSNLDTGLETSNEKIKKTKKRIKKTEVKENNSKNKNNSEENSLVDDSKTNNTNQKNSSARNSKANKQESLKVETEVKPKTRSQSTKEEKSQNKTSNQLDTKPSTRSKSTSQLNLDEINIPNNSQMKKRISLSLRSKNNNIKMENSNEKIKKTEVKENNFKNKNNCEENSLVDDSKTNNTKQKKSSARNSKANKQESLKVETEVKPKTRSQSTKEEKSQNKTSNQLDTKPSTRSKSTSQLDLEEINIPNNSQMKKRISLSLRSKNNNTQIPQIDGADDSDDELSEEEANPKTTKKPSKRLKSLPDYTEADSEDDFKPPRPKRSAKINTQSKVKSSSSKNTMPKEKTSERNKAVNNHKLQNQNDDDSDYKPESTNKKENDTEDDDSEYEPQSTKKKYNESDDEFYENKVKVKRVRTKKDVDDVEPKPKKGFDVWVEVYLEAEEKWISVDVVKGQVHCANELRSRASHPITYIVAWNNDNSIKDITQRYCPNWNTVTRKLRIDKKWWNESIKPFEGQKSARDEKEDEELALLQLEKPLPGTIHEYKNHPLYVLKRHLLQIEGLYPPEPATLGFIRGEAVYSRACVHRLYTREVWFKNAKVVKAGETPYKIIKRPRWDKINRKILKDQPVNIFGSWQVEDYVPPAAENGMVPRNEYGNVELYQTCMLPKGTVHLQLPGLNKLARRMNIDCAPAMVGFDVHSGWNHPVYDGYVVCEEHSESLIAAWYLEQEEQEKQEQEKLEKRVYGNWKKLIKGLLIRERLKARYDFGVPSQAETATKKRKSKGPKFLSKKRRICSENESDSEGD